MVARACLEVVGLLSIELQPITVVGGNWLNLIIHGSDVPHLSLSLWQRWDALWYQQIAQHGYQAGNGTTSFYPLFPLLSRLTGFLFGDQVVLGQLVTASAAFAASLPLLYRLAHLDMKRIPAVTTIILMLSFPVAFFFLVPYTESLYLALSVAAFWFARTDRPWVAGLAGFAAALTRAQGAFLTLPLCFLYLQRRGETGKGSLWGVLSGTLPGLGAIAVILYFRRVVGEWETGLAGQARWGYTVVSPWQSIAASWHYVTTYGDPVELLNLVTLLLFTILAVWVTLKLPLAYALYVWPYLAVLFCREMYVSPLMSVSRYLLVLFPCFLVVAPPLARRWPLALGLVAVMACLQVTLFIGWVHFSFIA